MYLFDETPFGFISCRVYVSLTTCTDGLGGYDIALTRRGSWVRVPVGVPFQLHGGCQQLHCHSSQPSKHRLRWLGFSKPSVVFLNIRCVEAAYTLTSCVASPTAIIHCSGHKSVTSLLAYQLQGLKVTYIPLPPPSLLPKCVHFLKPQSCVFRIFCTLPTCLTRFDNSNATAATPKNTTYFHCGASWWASCETSPTSPPEMG